MDSEGPRLSPEDVTEDVNEDDGEDGEALSREDGGEALSPESNKRGRNDSPAASYGSKRSSIRSDFATSIVRRNQRLINLSRSGMLDKLLEKLFNPVGTTKFSDDPRKVTQQIENIRTMTPVESNIVLTDVKIFYNLLPSGVFGRSFRKIYRYVFFKFNDAIFSLNLSSVLYDEVISREAKKKRNKKIYKSNKKINKSFF